MADDKRAFRASTPPAPQPTYPQGEPCSSKGDDGELDLSNLPLSGIVPHPHDTVSVDHERQPVELARRPSPLLVLAVVLFVVMLGVLVVRLVL